jgi:hypothetical protein
MLKYVSKFTMDILPSVIATIVGAYIVNHYIVAKPAADAPAAAASAVAPKKAALAPAGDAKPSERSAHAANVPEPGVTAKGISERAMIEKTAAERPAAVEKPVEKSVEKAAEKSSDKPVENANTPVETRRHASAPREKAVAKIVPAPVQPSATPVLAPAIAAPTTAPAVEAAVAPEEHRDANDLARAAIERLRGNPRGNTADGSPRAQELMRIPDAPRVVTATAPSIAAAPPIRPLPPPIMVSTPGAETFEPSAGSSQARPPYASAEGVDDPRRPVPPADIPSPPPQPSSGPLDLHADATEPPTREHTNVAEDMLSAAKSVFHAVLPK